MKRTQALQRTLSVGSIFVLMPLVAGCSGVVTAAPAATETVTAVPTATAISTATPKSTSGGGASPLTSAAATPNLRAAAWLKYVRDHAVSGTLQGQTDDELVAGAKKTCGQMQDGQLFEEVAYNLGTAGLPKPYQTDMQLVLGTGTVEFCPEFQPTSGTGDVAILQRLRTVAPTIAHNPDSAILSQARSACPSVSQGLAGGAATVQEARRAWGKEQGYSFIFISVLNFCSNNLNNVVANK